jgi:transposase
MRYEQYIGVDLHKAFLQACAVTADGQRLWEDRFPRTAEGLDQLRARCSATTSVAVEASTPTWHFADALQTAVGAVVIVDPVKTQLKAGFAAKTDRLDARRLADALRRESVVSIYYPSPAIRELRELCRSRHALVRTRTAVLLRLHALLLRQGCSEIPRRLYTAAHLAWLDTVPLPPQARASAQRLRHLIRDTTRELQLVDRDVLAAAAHDPIVPRLLRIPGLGPILGLLVRAEIGDITRFPTPGHLASYAGLVPRVDQSAGRRHVGRITRRGSPWLRWALIEAAIHGPRRADAEGRWGRRLALRRGALKARVALARRLCEEIMTHWSR